MSRPGNVLVVALLAASCVRAPTVLTVQPAPSAPIVGLKSIEGRDPIGPAPLKVLVMYPPATPFAAEAVTELAPYRLEGQFGGPVAEGVHPLVIISHGHAGSRLGHHDLAEHLAREGFIVASVEHAGDSWSDQSAFGTDRAMLGRAYQVSAAIDAVLADPIVGPHVDAPHIGVTGFSAGGYTALTVVGAHPDFTRHAKYCQRHPEDEEVCQVKELKKVIGDLRPMFDPRVKAAFVMAPLGVFFGPEAFIHVKTPVFLAWSDSDPVLLPAENAEPVQKHLKTLVGTHVVTGAGHFVFVAPCSAELAADAKVICEDPVGVDRVAVHRELNQKVSGFFKASLGP